MLVAAPPPTPITFSELEVSEMQGLCFAVWCYKRTKHDEEEVAVGVQRLWLASHVCTVRDQLEFGLGWVQPGAHCTSLQS